MLLSVLRAHRGGQRRRVNCQEETITLELVSLLFGANGAARLRRHATCVQSIACMLHMLTCSCPELPVRVRAPQQPVLLRQHVHQPHPSLIRHFEAYPYRRLIEENHSWHRDVRAQLRVERPSVPKGTQVFHAASSRCASSLHHLNAMRFLSQRPKIRRATRSPAVQRPR